MKHTYLVATTIIFSLIWRNDRDSFYGLDSRSFCEAYPRDDIHSFYFYKHSERRNNIVKMTCLCSTDINGLTDEFLESVTQTLKEHYGR